MRTESRALLVVLAGSCLCWAGKAPLLAQSQDDAATRQYAVAVGFQNKKLYDLAIDEWLSFIRKFPKDQRQDRARGQERLSQPTFR